MSEDQIFSRAFCLVHQSGDLLYPVKIRNRDTGNFSYRVSKDGNRKADSIALEEEDMIRYVIDKGYSVRCSTLKNGGGKKREGLYSPEGRSITSIRRAKK